MPIKKTLRIAIDGPVGAGKTSAGRLLAARLGYRFLDTGLMYRAVTLAALDGHVPMGDPAALEALAARSDIRLDTAPGGGAGILLNGKDVTARLRSPEVDRSVSIVSAVPGVRAVLVEKQRQIASGGDIVMAGRDIGTVVLRDAELKIFLDASGQTRARRRYEELRASGGTVKYDDVLAGLTRRDGLDSSRPASPLIPAADARLVDSDGLTLEQVVDCMEKLAAERAR